MEHHHNFAVYVTSSWPALLVTDQNDTAVAHIAFFVESGQF